MDYWRLVLNLKQTICCVENKFKQSLKKLKLCFFDLCNKYLKLARIKSNYCNPLDLLKK